MNFKQIAAVTLFPLLAVAPARLPAFELGFLDQAPMRFLTDTDTRLLDATVTDVLDNAKDGESRSWAGEDSTNSGTVTALEGFAKDGHQCRRIEIVTLAEQASKGRGSSRLDLCKIDGEWKILRVPR